jgi:hypothetical protein
MVRDTVEVQGYVAPAARWRAREGCLISYSRCLLTHLWLIPPKRHYELKHEGFGAFALIQNGRQQDRKPKKEWPTPPDEPQPEPVKEPPDKPLTTPDAPVDEPEANPPEHVAAIATLPTGPAGKILYATVHLCQGTRDRMGTP